ncbi:MAG TPA: M28 family peptidase [Thermoanaerobaculaceae bacterium]|nr:M28 family peptidase [Thermoanaerobaculaceae bacterium]HRS16408.1 M28 family peptidase [Thermoanaerobaculaceae bacterium]
MNRFDGERALQHVQAQCALGPRPAGSEAGRRCADLIASALADCGWPVEEDTFVHRGERCRNLLARAGGAGPALLLGAHYDTRPRADRERSWWRRRRPVPGANDGASGVAVLLELARVESPPPPGLWLAFFDAEDRGRLDGWEYCVGSARMAATLQPAPAAVIVADMVGGRDARFLIERSSTPWLAAAVWATAAALGLAGTFVAVPGHTVLDDHTPFLRRGVPAADIVDLDFAHWHRVSDTVEHVCAATLARVGSVLEAIVHQGAWRA